eukprot:366016-Chlamydomonas_euryale.AAC.2
MTHTLPLSPCRLCILQQGQEHVSGRPGTETSANESQMTKPGIPRMLLRTRPARSMEYTACKMRLPNRVRISNASMEYDPKIVADEDLEHNRIGRPHVLPEGLQLGLTFCLQPLCLLVEDLGNGCGGVECVGRFVLKATRILHLGPTLPDSNPACQPLGQPSDSNPACQPLGQPSPTATLPVNP